MWERLGVGGSEGGSEGGGGGRGLEEDAHDEYGYRFLLPWDWRRRAQKNNVLVSICFGRSVRGERVFTPMEWDISRFENIRFYLFSFWKEWTWEKSVYSYGMGS